MDQFGAPHVAVRLQYSGGNTMATDLDLYSIFCTVARCGSLSHAARELYVSQPAISQSMHRLEYALGCTLFTRTSRGISLTSEGRMLYSLSLIHI